MLELGVVVPFGQYGPDRKTSRWSEVKAVARRAEELGFDSIWVPDELVWFQQGQAPQGVWEGVSMMGAVAAVTSRAKVGSWVLSALHRNAALTAHVVEALDEISGGRFVFGLGAGHAWPGQAHAFGLPEDKIFDRFEEALQIVVPLLREGRANFEGTYHAARDLPQLPLGPRPGKIPLMIGGNGPRAQRLAVRHADIWSCYIDADTNEAFDRLPVLEAICAEEGRDPASIGRSVGLGVRPLAPAPERKDIVSGSAEEIATVIRALGDAGYTQVELQFGPPTIEALEALLPVLQQLR